MTLRMCAILQTYWFFASQRIERPRSGPYRRRARSGSCPACRRDDSGQATAEYALVIVGAAAVALLLLTWATGSGKITSLLDKMVDKIADMVR